MYPGYGVHSTDVYDCLAGYTPQFTVQDHPSFKEKKSMAENSTIKLVDLENHNEVLFD